MRSNLQFETHPRLTYHREARRSEEHHHESQEEHQKQDAVDPQFTLDPLIELHGDKHRIQQIKLAQHAGQEENRETQQQIAPVEYGLKSMQRVIPMRDYGRCRIHQISLGDSKLSPEEEHRHSHTQQDAAYRAVDEEENVVDAGTQQVARFLTVFIAYSLQHEAEENQDPEPVGTAETCGIEQWE